VGILVGTLGVAGYRSAIDRLRQLATAGGKKVYTMSMGRVNPNKLANFPEVRPKKMI
jgi:diphthamide biosynthesis protein 2